VLDGAEQGAADIARRGPARTLDAAALQGAGDVAARLAKIVGAHPC
jgi:hypothetical protein